MFLINRYIRHVNNVFVKASIPCWDDDSLKLNMLLQCYKLLRKAGNVNLVQL